MFKFHWTRKPDFTNIGQDIYKDYWRDRGFNLRSKLMEREKIFFDWIEPESKVLSMGCGNSRLLLELQEKRKCKVSGIDIEQAVVDGLNKNSIRAKVEDITKEDFKLDQDYDYIIMSEFLEHIVHPEKLIQKVKPYTKYLVLSVPNSAFYRYRIGLLFNGRFFTQWAKHPSEHLRFWSHIDFVDWLEALELKIEKTQSSNGPFLKNVWPNMFGHQICYLVGTSSNFQFPKKFDIFLEIGNWKLEIL